MTAPRRLQLRRGNSTAVSSYTGAAGEVVIDTTNWILYVHDGSTVGGYATTTNVAGITGNITQANLGLKGYVDQANTIQSQQISAANLGMKGYVDSVASQSIYGNSNVKSYLSGGFDGNIIPGANAVYSLGNSTTWWKDLYLSENTLYIGGVPIGSSGGSLTFGGNVVGTSALPTYTGPVSANTISVGATTVGNITTLPKVSIAGTSGNITAGNISTTGELITGGDISTSGNISTTGGFTASDLSFKLSAAGAVIELGAQNFKGSGYVPGRIYETATDGPGTGLRVMVVNVEYGPGSYASIGSPADGAVKIIDPGSGYTNGGLVYLSIRYPDESGTNALLTVYTQVNPVTYGTITANTSVWSFDESGNTTVPGDVLLPDNTAIYNVDANTAVFTSNVISDATSLYLTDTGNAIVYASDYIVLETNSDGNVSQQWSFNQNGNIRFPDATTQSTAFSNTAPIITTLNNNVTQANVGIIGYVDLANTIQSNQISAANLGMKGYVDNQITTITGSAPAILDTLGELANALGADANLSVTITSQIANVNANITTANLGMRGYVDSQSFYSNAKVATYLQSGNIANVSVAGNVTATYFVGNGALLTGIVGGAGNYGNIDVKAFLETDAGPADNFERKIEGYYANLILGDTTKLFSFGNSSKSYFGHDGFANININYVRADNADVRIATNNGDHNWTFSNAGNLTLPAGGRILESTYLSADSIILKPNGGTSSQYLEIAPTAVDGNHVHLMTGSGTELFLGDDNHYVKLANTGGVVINSNDGTGNTAQWTFGKTGTTQFPGSKILAPAGESITMWSDNYSQLMWENANLTVAPNMAINSNFYVAQNNATLDIGYRDGSSTQIIKSWYWNADGNLKLPSGGYILNSDDSIYGGGDYSNVQVAAYLNTQGYNLYSNVNVAAYLSTATITTTGNITAQNLIGNISITGNVTGTSANVTLQAGSYSSTFDNQGNVRLPTAYVTGNVTANYFIGNGALLTGIAASSNYSNVNVATYLPTYSGNIANIRLGVSGVLTFADGTTQITAGGGSYSNVQVATYLPAYGGAIQSSNVQTTSANIQATTAATNTATGALRVMGGVGVAGALFAGQLNTTGNLIANAISAYSLNTVANVIASVVNAGTINSAGNVLAQNLIGTIATASQTNITAVGTLATLTVSGNVSSSNFVGSTPNVQLIANTSITTFDIYGNVTLPGNLTVPNSVTVGGNLTVTGTVSGGTIAATVYLLEAYASVTYTLPGSFTEDPCRYSVVSANVNVSSSWFDTSTYTFTPQKAGYWEITAAYDVYRNGEASLAIKKNNSIVAAAGSFNAVAQQVTKIIYLNGSTDSANVINVGGAALSRSQYDGRSWFQARWVGA
jgi:hypothetical protein